MKLHVGDYISLYIFKNGYTFGVDPEIYKITEILNPFVYPNNLICISLDGKKEIQTRKNKICFRFKNDDKLISSQLSFLDELGG